MTFVTGSSLDSFYESHMSGLYIGPICATKLVTGSILPIKAVREVASFDSSYESHITGLNRPNMLYIVFNRAYLPIKAGIVPIYLLNLKWPFAYKIFNWGNTVNPLTS